MLTLAVGKLIFKSEDFAAVTLTSEVVSDGRGRAAFRVSGVSEAVVAGDVDRVSGFSRSVCRVQRLSTGRPRDHKATPRSSR